MSTRLTGLFKFLSPVSAPSAGAGRPLVASARSSLLVAIAEALEAERAQWLCWAPVAFAAGCLVYFSLGTEPGFHLTAGVALAVAALVLVRPRSTLAAVLCGLLAWAGLGFVAAKVRTETVMAPIVPANLGERQVTGVIAGIEPRDRGGERLTLEVTSIAGLAAHELPRRVRLNVKGGTGALVPGDHVGLVALLLPPAGPAAPGEYDFARFSFFRGIGAVGAARSEIRKVPAPEEAGWTGDLQSAIAGMRRTITERVLAALPGQTGAVAVALLTGQRGAISEEMAESFRDSGLAHVLAISGLHMAIMAGSVFFGLRLVLALFPSIALRFPIKKWAAVGAALGGAAYLMISGASFATIRAFVMVLIMFVAILVDRPAIALRNVALAALAILMVFPESVIDPGFQMSFAAVIALVAGYEAVRGQGRDLARIEPRWLSLPATFLFGVVASTLLASAAVAPFGVYHFHETQHYGILANLLAVPVLNLLIMPAALAALVVLPLGLEAGPLLVMGWGLDVMLWTAAWVAGLPGAVGSVPAMPPSSLLVMTAGGLWLAIMRQRWRVLGLAGIGAGLALAPLEERPDVLIGGEGRLVAVRGANGLLSAAGGQGEAFALSQWLKRDGDTREPGEVAPGPVLACDRLGCAGTVKGRVIALARHPAALHDDCRRADILVLEGKRPDWCVGPAFVADRAAIEGAGGFAIRIGEDGTLTVTTTAQARGRRPWTMGSGGASQR